MGLTEVKWTRGRIDLAWNSKHNSCVSRWCTEQQVRILSTESYRRAVRMILNYAAIFPGIIRKLHFCKALESLSKFSFAKNTTLKLAVSSNGQFWVSKPYHWTTRPLQRNIIRKKDQQGLNLCLGFRAFSLKKRFVLFLYRKTLLRTRTALKFSLCEFFLVVNLIARYKKFSSFLSLI